jgi:general secretion pathway protein A
MYKDYFNLKENPFNITADPDFYFSSTKHNEAFGHLLYGINQRKGIIVISGEIGTGKTTLCRTLLTQLDEEIKTALILNPSFSDTQLLKLIIKDLGIETKARNRFDLVDALNNFLLKETSLGNNVVVIIDEAQNLKPKQLEQIRLLSNLETEKEKLLQIVLVGQPELLEKLKLPELRQLNQRVSVRYSIPPLQQPELQSYIDHRINLAYTGNGSNNKPLFTDEAVKAIFEHSQGTPRMINILCDRALLAGFAQEMKSINEQIIHQCAKEVGE